MAVIEFQDVSKSFSHTGGAKLLRAHVRDLFRHRPRSQDFYALRDVSFRVEPGESLAVVGGNGAGKSTLLSLVAGLCRPTSGYVTVNGRVAALLELGSGFHSDLTGRENIALNASLLGFSHRDTARRFEEIVEFAGVGDFIDEPVRTYSSGMTMRLAFSVAVHVDPDILIIDEVLAVGDQRFQALCLERILEFRRRSKTLLFVSHSEAMVRNLCDRAIWLNQGRLDAAGKADSVLAAYANRPVHTA